jgi:ribosomal-protein-alanine N-acetyltransferase
MRVPRLADASMLRAECTGDPAVTRFLTFPTHLHDDETREFLGTCIEEGTNGRAAHWVLVRPDDRRPVGLVSLRRETHANLSYFLSRVHWGRGYMTEVVSRVIEWAGGLEELERVWALCDAENAASIRVLEKAGLVREQTLPAHMVFPNISARKRDCIVFVRARGEVPAVPVSCS